MYSVLLVAVDGSARAAEVVRAAVELAERFDARVRLFRSIAVPQVFPAGAKMPLDETPALMAEQAHQDLRDLAAGNPRVSIEPVDVATPQPWRAILEAAVRVDADLIVVGSHGYAGWDRVLGTTAAKVANHADRNVLVVHERMR